MPLLSVRDGSRTVLDTLTAVLFRIGRIAAAEDDDVFLAHQRPAALDVRYESRTAARGLSKSIDAASPFGSASGW